MNRRALLCAAACAALVPAAALADPRRVGSLRNSRRAPLPAIVLPVGTTLNPADKYSTITLSNGNLTATGVESADRAVRSTSSKSAGKWHIEVTINNDGGINRPMAGFATAAFDLSTLAGFDAGAQSRVVARNSYVFVAANLAGGDGVDMTIGVPTAYALDLDTGQFWFQRANGGGWQGPFGIGAGPWFIVLGMNQNVVATVNFGASAFAVTPRSGFSAWG